MSLQDSPVAGSSSGGIELIRIMAKADWLRFVSVVGLGLVLALTDGAIILLLLPLIQGLPSGVVSTESWPILGLLVDQVPVWTVGVALVAIVAIRGLIGLARDRTTAHLRFEVLDRERTSVMRGVLLAQWEWVASRRTSELIQTVNAEISRVGSSVDLFSRVVVSFLEIMILLAIATIWEPISGLIAMGILVAVFGLLGPSVRLSYRLGRDQVEANRTFARTLTDVLSSLRVIRINGSHGRRIEAVKSSMAAVAQAHVRYATRVAAHRGITAALAILLCLVVLAVSYQIGAGVSELIVLAVLLLRLLASVQALSTSVQQLSHSLPAIAQVVRLRQESDAHADPRMTSGRISSGLLAEGSIEVACEGVSFSYSDDPLIADFDLLAPRSQVTAITGVSGVGKSTFLDIVLGLVTPDRGTITIQGVEGSPVVFEELRSRTGYVPQDQRLMPGTLRENLTWISAREVTDEECFEALGLVDATFLSAWPEGLDTLLGDHSYRISGGERQRIAIAGALLRSPDLIILDEATSALDLDAERSVMDAIRAKGATVLMVTHRPEALGRADRVIRLGGAGDHEEAVHGSAGGCPVTSRRTASA